MKTPLELGDDELDRDSTLLYFFFPEPDLYFEFQGHCMKNHLACFWSARKTRDGWKCWLRPNDDFFQ